MLKNLKFLIAGILWLLIVAIASLVSVSYIPEVNVGFSFADTLAHAIFYLIATFLLYLHFRKSSDNRTLFKIGMFCFVYGTVVEVLQYVMPYNRAFEWTDIFANATGVILAIVLIKFVLEPYRR